MGTLIKINGFDIFHEVTGKGAPIIWCHEAAGDYRSWDPQVKFALLLQKHHLEFPRISAVVRALRPRGLFRRDDGR
jgi:hypothetical protein